MSSVAITGNASGAGVFTLASPNSASSFTATLPTATTTLVGTDATQTLTNKTLTTPNIDSAQFATVSGTAPIYPCRAWVNLNGSGTPTPRASGNVTSITDNGNGDYTVVFTTALTDANYSVEVTGGNGSAKVSGGGQATWGWAPYNFNSTDVSATFWVYTGSSNTLTLSDSIGTYACFAVFR
jgi:hypothetical protein